jgi:acylphosphatase
MSRITRHLRIHGTVQGVWYRESMRQEAGQLGVTGWVRNRFDGSVEAVVQGAPHAVEAMIEWCKRGPERAGVTRVEIVEAGEAASGNERFDSFLTFPTA